MGLRLNLGSGAHPLPEFDNLTPPDWHFEDGLFDYEDATVEGITISHALMYLPLTEWPRAFAEFARVLEPGGVVRITEDATDDRRSSRYGGFPGAVTLTTRDLVTAHLIATHLDYHYPTTGVPTLFRDTSLIQTWHGDPPKVFHVEGLKP